MICEILSVGTELLMGQIANTDAQYLSHRLSEMGVAVYRHTTVGDNAARLKDALKTAISRSDMVIATGGLGPTEDDLTKETVAEYFGLPLILHEESLSAIRAYMERGGFPMTTNNTKQALMPEGAIVLPNRHGTAPGCVVEAGDKTVAVLPGPPWELKEMYEHALRPYLEQKCGGRLHSRYLRIFGVGESRVETKLSDLFHLGDPTLALYCGTCEVTARLTTFCETGDSPAPRLNPVEAEIRARLGDAVYAEGLDETMASTVYRALLARGETLSVAESCTGGLLASSIVDLPGASSVFKEGYIAYANDAKVRLLGVKEETLRQYGAVSAECAAEMALGAREKSGCDWALSTTGIAGPDGGSDEKPVGTVFIAFAGANGARTKQLSLRGKRNYIRAQAAAQALNFLRLTLISNDE